ncbi:MULTISPECIES: alpha-ketoacid dehydrogenase subunit beta [Paenibacillus]|uniref:alpha-ketoacid dehydrogenase subunit beta n=1 Tax=Paenibacillus TaxID=44249 RepID=UPI0022B891EE|nr:alpha-ketoacid dehydrogenase subunit beta [Paenibacillus caseinilyticus]MCZ8522878.1 alpha-ketoacid dehydrogenase subunit beta [Paenibacillus caseinilyticus]
MAQLTMIQAINDALRCELRRDSSVLVFGEDVGKAGGVHRATQSLQEEFGEERVFDTPLAESAIGGLAIGLGIQGFRPVAEIQFSGFLFEAMDQICVQAARMRYRSGGRYHAPITFRAPFGGGVKGAELHSEPLEGLLMQTPGLKVVIPSGPYDAKGLMIAAIRDNDPVFVFEHMKLYRTFREEVPEEAYTVPLGKAKVVREGTDLTLVTYGAMVHASLKAADEVQRTRGAQVEVIDLRTLMPLDMDTVAASVRKTGRAMVVQEAQRTSGAAAEVIAGINERAILHLEAPVLRVTSPDTVFAFSLIEDEWIPNPARIAKGIYSLLDY